SSPLLETSIDGAQGILMNISGGENLSLFEVQEAADLVTSAADSEVNVIFGNVINENLKEEVIVTVIATGFDETQHHENNQPEKEKGLNKKKQQENNKTEKINRKKSYPKNQEIQDKESKTQNTKEEPEDKESKSQEDDTLDIPTFLRNRNRNR